VVAVLPIPVYPYPPTPEQVQAIKAAKDALCKRDGIEFGLQVARAVPASPVRVLAFAPPPFLCEAAMVRSLEPAEMERWLEWCLDEEQPVEAGLTWEKWFSYAFKAPVKEVTHEYSGADQFQWMQDREDAKERGVRFEED